MALDARVGHIVIDNDGDIDRLERLAPAAAPQPVLLRVTPDVRGETHDGISTGQADSNSASRLAAAPGAIERIRSIPGLDLRGLHIHIGSHSSRSTRFARRSRRSRRSASSRSTTSAAVSGWRTRASRSRPRSRTSSASWSRRHELLGPGRRLLIEPGRALVANGCVTLYRVIGVKRNASTWVSIDGGMSDNLRPMLYGARYEADVADRPGGSTRVHLTGRHCESSDVVIRDALLDDPRPGDVVVTPVTGAYGHAMANNYNGVPRPPVIFCRDGEARVVIRRETFHDLHSRDVNV